MKRLLLFLCCISLSWLARGQAAYEWRYWFDMGLPTGNTGRVFGERFTIETDSYGLSEGIHTINMQVTDTAGRFSPPFAQLFYHVTDNTVKKLHYWFDNEEALTHSIPMTQGNFSIDVSGLAPGLHFIYCIAEDAAGNRSDALCRAFYRQPKQSALRWSYWFDEEENARATIPLPNGVVMIDISELQEGFHVFHSQVLENASSDITTTMFIKVPQTEGTDYMTCISTVDGNLVAEEKLSAAGGILKWDMDVSKMDVGLHKAMFQVITPSGAASTIAERYFIREITSKELGNMKCVYAIDNQETYSQAGTHSNGVFHFDLDVASIENGLHRIAYMLVCEEGVTTPQKTAFFWKTPLGGDGIVQYDYWLNENDDQKHSVRLTERTNPFNLISLLPVEVQPIRTSNFKFAIKDGEPQIYARNEFHIQFFDTNGRIVEETKEYVDEQVSMPVKPVGELLATQTFPKIAENDIRWYTIECERGDYLEFKLNRAATIQLFSPSGKEVYNASGLESTTWGGCNVGENGIYYFALHDITALQGTTISIDYNHIGKYAILTHTPNKLSANGTTMMHLSGNGLSYVESIELVYGDDIVTPDTIVANNSDLLAFFVLDKDLDEEQAYSLNVTFYDEVENSKRSIYKPDAVTLEPVKEGEIAVNVETERRVGDPYPIKVTIRNTGNVGFYNIPVDIAFDHPEKIDEFSFLDFRLMLSDSIYNSREFFTYTNNLVGTGQKGFFMPILIPYLAPYEERTYTFGIKTKIAHARFNFYAWAGEPWDDGIDSEDEINRSEIRRNAPRCNPSNIPDVYDVADLGGRAGQVLRPWIGVGEAIGGIIQGSTRAREDALFDAYGIPPSERDDYRFQYQNCVRSPYDIARDAHPFQIRKKAKSRGTIIDVNASSNCPSPTPHGIDVYIPGDPNEMHGPVSESGSKYIRQNVLELSYSIEFENDPRLANASAHKIVVCDTLNTNVFDTSTFKPISIKLGNKSIDLEGEQNFIKTVDLRTEINAIAQIKLEFSQNAGIAIWTISSLDPMTMEETYDIMQGVLPVNNNGNGIGFVNYDVDLKKPLFDGTEIKNRASIVFDYEDAILTPTWTNIVDAVAPTSKISDLSLVNDTTLRITADGFDARSGVWKYEWYVQAGENAPWWKEGETDSLCFDYRVYADIDYGFCVVATDSAGNVEKKVIQRERGFRMDDQGNVDAIIDVPVDAGNDNPEAVYDLSGRKQLKPQENRINIVGKKKILYRREGQ